MINSWQESTNSDGQKSEFKEYSKEELELERALIQYLDQDLSETTVPPEVWRMLLAGGPMQTLASNMTPEQSFSVIPTIDTARIRWLVAANPNTPPNVLAFLAKKSVTSLLERIAGNPRTPVSTLYDLAQHPEAEVRAAVAENSHLPEEIVWRLVRDENPDVRYVLAENYHLSAEILDLLCQDENPYVSFRAKKTMSRLCPSGIVEAPFGRSSEKMSTLQ